MSYRSATVATNAREVPTAAQVDRTRLCCAIPSSTHIFSSHCRYLVTLSITKAEQILHCRGEEGVGKTGGTQLPQLPPVTPVTPLGLRSNHRNTPY